MTIGEIWELNKLAITSYIFCLLFGNILAQYSLAHFVRLTNADAVNLRNWQKQLKFPFSIYRSEFIISDIFSGFYYKGLRFNRNGSALTICVISIGSEILMGRGGTLTNLIFAFIWLIIYAGTIVSLWRFGHSLIPTTKPD